MSDRNDALPQGWVEATLADVTTHSTEKAKPGEFGAAKYIGLEHIEAGNNRIVSVGDVSTVKSTKTVFRSGDVLYGKLRPYLRKVCRPKFDGVCSTDILVFPQCDYLDNGYLLHFLSQQSTSEFATQNSKGINLPRISPERLGQINFPIPPLAEQRRIVSKIESLQEQSSRARRAISESGPLLEQFRQSVLRAAFSGRLTADWRAANPNVEPTTEFLSRIRTERRHRWELSELAKYKAKGKQPPKNWQDKYKEPKPLKDYESENLPALPEPWCWARLGELIESIDAGRSPKAHSRPAEAGESGVLKVSAVTWREFDPTANKALRDGDAIEDTPTPRTGDVLISRANTVELIGAVVLVKADYPNLMLSDKLLRLNRVSDDIMPEFLLFGLRSKPVRDSFEANATGTSNSMRNLSQAKILDAPIALAPVEEQSQVAELLVSAGENADVLETMLAGAESALTQLDQSILAKAFRGELVPQNPGDEPASVLLERIREAHKAQQKKNSTAKSIKKRPVMRKNVGEKLTEWVSKVDKKTFTFGDLRRDISGDYDELKDAVYALLDKKTELEQVFDDSTGEMCFRRLVK